MSFAAKCPKCGSLLSNGQCAFVCGWTPEPVKFRANYLHILPEARLNAACVAVNKALGGYGCYLVGSCVERSDYRDVDVRFVMENNRFDQLFPRDEESDQHNALWHLLCFLISDYLSTASKLPVDFQIQRQAEANAKYKGKHRAALGLDIFPCRIADGGV